MKIKFAKFSRVKANLDKKTRVAKGVFSGPKLVTCLEIAEEHIKLAQFETTQEGKKLVYLFTRKIPSLEEEAVIKTLRAVLSELKIKGRILSCIARHQVTVRYLKLPSANPRELESMLDFQITKQIPYPKEETVYSYQLLGTDSAGYADILLAIVHIEVVSQHLRILKACNLEPEKVSFNALASCGWFLYSSQEFQHSVLLVDVDTVYTNIGVVNAKGLFFTRAIKLGVNDFEQGDSPSALQQLNEEIRLSLSAFAKEYPAAEITRVVLSGAASLLDKIKDALEQEFEFEIEIRLALEKIKLKKDVLEENWFDTQRVSLTAIIGLGLEEAVPVRLNLIPADIKELRMQRHRQYQAIFSAILSGLIFLTVLGFISKKIYEKRQNLRYLNQAIREISNEAEALEEKKRNFGLVKDMFANRSLSLDIIFELHKIVPAEINLVSLDFENNKGLALKGTSKVMAEVFRFVTILDKSDYFANSQVKFVRKRTGTEELTDFEIYCLLKNLGESNR